MIQASTLLDGLAPALLDALIEGVVVHDPEGRIVYANPAAQRILRTPLPEMQSRGLRAEDWEVLRSDGQALAVEAWPVARVLSGEDSVRGELLGFRARDGERAMWFVVNAVAVEIQQRRHVIATFEESIAPLGFRFRDVVESSRDIVLVTDADLGSGGPRIVYVNPAFSLLTGYSLDEVVGRSPRFLQGPETADASRKEIRDALAAGAPVRTTILNYSKSGRPYWLDLQISPIHDLDGRITHFAAFERDMSANHAELERALHASMHDPLTNVLNRRGFHGLAEPVQARCRREGGVLVLMALDLDRFKSINDRFGHAEGDRVLQELARLVSRRLRDSDLFARLGGEEFAVLASVSGLAAGLALAESIRRLVHERLRAGTPAEPVTVSLGVHASDGRDSLSTLLEKADAQLYRAKKAGRNRVMQTDTPDRNPQP